jgi:NarL family two-component system response regulator LiaR
MKSTAVLIADSRPIVRRGLSAFLASQPALEMVGEADSGELLVELVAATNPDVILLDLALTEGGQADLIERLLERKPEVRIVVLTGFEGEDRLMPALRAGALGFVLKDASSGELLEVIDQVTRGQPSFSGATARSILREISHDPEGVRTDEPLTRDEVMVLGEIARRRSDEAIAASLLLSPATVRAHVRSIFTKLNISRRRQAVLYALKHGMATIPAPPDTIVH